MRACTHVEVEVKWKREWVVVTGSFGVFKGISVHGNTNKKNSGTYLCPERSAHSARAGRFKAFASLRVYLLRVNESG